jgi:hypothetical protein
LRRRSATLCWCRFRWHRKGRLEDVLDRALRGSLLLRGRSSLLLRGRSNLLLRGRSNLLLRGSLCSFRGGIFLGSD